MADNNSGSWSSSAVAQAASVTRHGHQISSFLRLPAELRLRLYDLVFPPQEYLVHWLVKDLVFTHMRLPCPHTPSASKMAEHIFALREQYPHFASQRRRHRQVGLTHTTDANLLDGLPPGPRGLTALLLTCTQINQETTPILYGNSGFHFVSRKALNSFLLLLSASAKISIRYLRVRYEPSLTPDKLGLDTQGQQRWALTCEKLVKELKGLEGLILVVDMASNAFYHFRHGPACQSLDGWVVPWLLLRECQWRSVEILSNGTDAAAGESPAAQLRRELLGSKLRETDALAISYWYNEHGMITGKYAPRYKACKSASYSLNAENFCPFGDGQWFYKA